MYWDSAFGCQQFHFPASLALASTHFSTWGLPADQERRKAPCGNGQLELFMAGRQMTPAGEWNPIKPLLQGQDISFLSRHLATQHQFRTDIWYTFVSTIKLPFGYELSVWPPLHNAGIRNSSCCPSCHAKQLRGICMFFFPFSILDLVFL